MNAGVTWLVTILALLIPVAFWAGTKCQRYRCAERHDTRG
jgi:hypothetical protein